MQPLKTSKSATTTIVILVGAILLLGYQFNQYALKREVANYLLPYFLNTLEESMFSDNLGIVNDPDSIVNAGTKINSVLNNILNSRWYSGTKNCQVTVYKIDGESITQKNQSTKQYVLLVPRNKISRPVEYGLSCQHNIESYFLWAILIAIVFYLIYFLIPYPLTQKQIEWMSYLLENGYDRRLAYACCSEVKLNSLPFTKSQTQSFNALHIPEKKNFREAIQLVSDHRIINLSQHQIDWLEFFMPRCNYEVDQALTLTLSPDIVEIDLEHCTLKIHAIDIEIKKTPLFYYAWYANKKIMGDGWLTNPQSNIPEKEPGKELAMLMSTYSGHAKAVYDLEEFGLKSKTLDQNRSKIKEVIVSVLGEKLAIPYLFEVQKDETRNRMSYRLKTSSDQIRLLTSSPTP